MLLDDREGGAENVFLAQTQASREALYEAGFARAELTGESEQLTAFE
jgi:hypothetical protein